GPARGDENDDGEALAGGEVEQPSDLFADHDAHASAHELEVHYSEGERTVLDRRGSDDDGIVASACGARLFHPLRVGARIDEFQGIADGEVGEHLAPRAAVDGDRKALAHGEAVVMAAFGADVEVALDFLAEGDLPAGRAFGPDVVGRRGRGLLGYTRGIGGWIRGLSHRDTLPDSVGGRLRV